MKISSVKISSLKGKVNTDMFIGREKEINIIKGFLKKKGALMCYGLRRVGKTTLIKKVLNEEQCNYVYFECQKANEEVNVKLFVELLKEKLNFIDAQFDTFLSVFKVFFLLNAV